MTDFWSTGTLDPANDVSPPFNAKYAGTCSLPTCERGGVVEQGDVCQYVLESLVHMVCARRIAREQTAPLCQGCYHYHEAGKGCA